MSGAVAERFRSTLHPLKPVYGEWATWTSSSSSPHYFLFFSLDPTLTFEVFKKDFVDFGLRPTVLLPYVNGEIDYITAQSRARNDWNSVFVHPLYEFIVEHVFLETNNPSKITTIRQYIQNMRLDPYIFFLYYSRAYQFYMWLRILEYPTVNNHPINLFDITRTDPFIRDVLQISPVDAQVRTNIEVMITVVNQYFGNALFRFETSPNITRVPVSYSTLQQLWRDLDDIVIEEKNGKPTTSNLYQGRVSVSGPVPTTVYDVVVQKK